MGEAKPKVLLIGWDAADWKVIDPLMDAGKMPNLQRLIDNGAMGQIATLHPALSPMLWTSIATGKRPFKHGVHGFAEPTPDGLAIQPVTNLSRKCKAVWNILSQSGFRSVVIGWWPSHPAEPIDGVMVSDHYHRASGPLDKGWPLKAGAVHPRELHDTLANLRMHPDDVIREMVEPFIPRLREIDQAKDPRLAACIRTLCECASVHSAATHLMDHEPWNFFAVYYDAIDHFSHGFMKYHPPRQEFVSQADFDLYRNVVSMAYQFHDQMLGTLLEKAGEDVTAILTSDHGFHPDHLRVREIPSVPAGPAVEHRDFGVFVMKGAGIKKDALLHGIGLLDIAPTVLTLFDLPVGEDMDGAVVASAFVQSPRIKTIPSWEEVPGNDGRHPPHTRLDPMAARESLEQLVALGYIARPDENIAKAVADTVTELRYNLAQAYQDDARHGEALQILRELHQADPDEQRFAVHRFVSCQALGLVEEMAGIAADLDGRRRARYREANANLARFSEVIRERKEAQAAAQPADAPGSQPAGDRPVSCPPVELLSEQERRNFVEWRKLARFDPPVVDYLMAQVRVAQRRFFEALELLERVTEVHLARPGLLLQTADLLMRLRRWEQAEQAFARALRIDPDNFHAHAGMSRTALRRGDFAAAAQSALNALQRMYHYPLAHFLLGEAMMRMGVLPRAAEAFRTALSINPNFPQAQRRLASIASRLGNPAEAATHRMLARELKHQPAAGQPAISPDSGAERIGNGAPTGGPPPGAVTTSQVPEGDGPTALSEWVVVVTGLPRSGTSMIMQMLAAGGMPILSDGLRAADEDNPRGYFEFEPVLRLHQGTEWLDDAKGHAVKIVAPLIPYLPPDRHYRVVFIERNMEEVIASQSEMIARGAEKLADTSERRHRLMHDYERQVQSLQIALRRNPRIQTLLLNHAQVVRDPKTAARTINHFLGGTFDVEKMAAEVKPALHRKRSGVS